MKPDVILCHYGEIGLKGKNRSYFEKKLLDNIRVALKRSTPASFKSISRMYGRLIIRLVDGGCEEIDVLFTILKSVCGLVYFAPAIQVKQDIEQITKVAVAIMSKSSARSFRVTTRRTDKNFPESAHKINEEVGAAVVAATGKNVNLGQPDKTCFIDIVDNTAFVYTEKISGQGGLPVGVSGKVVSLLSGGIDSPVAAYYVLKRGASVSFIHFHSVPFTNKAAIEKVREMIQKLQSFQQEINLHLVALAPIQKEVMVLTAEKYRIILYRRFMVRIAAVLAKKLRCGALVTGDSLGQVASQTLENISVIGDAIDIPLLQPLIGLDKLEIIDKAKEIGTYDISVQPDQDCCTLFVPKHPVTKAKLSDIVAEEEKLNGDEMVKQAVDTMIVEKFE